VNTYFIHENNYVYMLRVTYVNVEHFAITEKDLAISIVTTTVCLITLWIPDQRHLYRDIV